MTLADLSTEMLADSRVPNPECEHVTGDMRTARFGRRFDAVFIHDAIMYMTRCASGTIAMFAACLLAWTRCGS